MPKQSTRLACPRCGGKSLVLGTRSYEHHITRERQCQECEHRFSSREMADTWIDHVRKRAAQLDLIVMYFRDVLDRLDPQEEEPDDNPVSQEYA